VGEISTSATFPAERLGVSAAEGEFSRLGWAFHEQRVADYGIDAQVEPFFEGVPSGQLIALQIKSGASFFSKKNEARGGWTYRGRDRHLRYWLRYCRPVLLLLHNPESRLTYWVHITADAVEYTSAGWKILVPSAQLLCRDSGPALWALADSAPGASDDPVEESCAKLPPMAAEVLRATEKAEPGGTLRLAALLARGRHTPRLTVEAALSAPPSWLPRGGGRFEVALGMYAGEHGHPDLAAESLTRAARYKEQPAVMLLAYAALSAAEGCDIGQARELLNEIPDGQDESLLLATARAVVQHLGQPGPVPVPDILANASPAERAAEPTCLSFLGTQALRRQDATAAVNYFEEACSAQPSSTSLMLQLAQGLQTRVVAGQAAVEAEDMRRIQAAAREALEQRRRWSGPSSPALAMLIRQQMLTGAFEAAARLATPAPDGEALEEEAAADEVVILGTQAALTLGDRQRARQFAARARTEHAQRVVSALLADPGLPADQEAQLWRAVLSGEPPGESRMLALHRLACLGEWPLPGLDELRDSGMIDDVHHDILAARAKAGRGDITAALSVLRNHASASPTAAEMLVDLLQEAERFDEALDEAARGFERFGEAILAHKRLNLLVLADQPDEAAAEATRLLARPDTAPELRLRTRQRLIGHYAYHGDWPAVEDQSRAALAEFPGLAGLQWSLIAATWNRGQLDRAGALFSQFNPEIITTAHAGLWLSQHLRCGFSLEDVNTALGLLDRWPDDADFEGQVLTAFLGASGRRGPAGNLILPELDPPTLDRFQARMASYLGRNPDGPVQLINGDPRDLADMLRGQLAPQAERLEHLERQVRGGRASLATIAALTRRSYAKALLERACGVIVAVTTDPDPFARELTAADAALDGPVVIQSSAIAVATLLLDRWAGLRGAFTDLRLPRDAWADFQAARYDLLRDPEGTFSIGYDLRRNVLVSHQVSQADHDYLARRIADVENALRGTTVVATPELDTFADYSPAETDAALSPLALAAKTDLPLWCDDVVIRVLAEQHGIPTFGTAALLHALIEAQRLPDTLRQDILGLARGYVVDMMLTPEELLSLAAEARYQPGPATAVVSRAVFWAEPRTAQEVFLELIGTINDHAPKTITAWLIAACTGLAARRPDGPPAGNARLLAEAVSARVHADDDFRGHLIRAAKEATEAQQATYPEGI
jgi:tetratricopeptide (TPR) repeat protein